MKNLIGVVVLSLVLFTACSSRNTDSSMPEKHYALSGKIVSLDGQRQTATVDGAAIPGYMEAMTMEYPVKSKSDFQSLKVGAQITATVDVAGDASYALTNIKPKP